MRGEYPLAVLGVAIYRELPPRTRRILLWDDEEGDCLGTTSACAENTARTLPAHAPNRNYLRVRGEYDSCHDSSFLKMELPPRARRILAEAISAVAPLGTTSACAENTTESCSGWGVGWNYLRVRGEYHREHDDDESYLELPPRARRIRPGGVRRPPENGTTSACAENTSFPPQRRSRWRNYLRVRGEYSACSAMTSSIVELPPRARRIHGTSVDSVRPRGTTSACAENTTTKK